MQARGAALLFAATILATAWTAAPVASAENCAPYPIGRCGAYDRERVIFCYHGPPENMVDASSPAITVGRDGTNDVLHIRTAPTEGFAGDVMNAPLPFESVYRDTNFVKGLQVKESTCGMFEWWAECDSWMGPYNIFTAAADEQVV